MTSGVRLRNNKVALGLIVFVVIGGGKYTPHPSWDRERGKEGRRGNEGC